MEKKEINKKTKSTKEKTKKLKATKKVKEEKYKVIETTKLNKIEKIITIVVGLIFLTVLVCSMINEVFIPAALISFALFLFCICYHYIEDETKKRMVYTLFGLGVLLIIIEVVYTIIKVS